MQVLLADCDSEFIKEEPAWEAIPMIFITDEELECKTDCKADFRRFDCMKKPYSLTQLVGRLQACELNSIRSLV
jgi:hypothetical protein